MEHLGFTAEHVTEAAFSRSRENQLDRPAMVIFWIRFRSMHFCAPRRHSCRRLFFQTNISGRENSRHGKQKCDAPHRPSEPEMSIFEFTLSVFLISGLAGFLGALTGLGGGVVVTPALTLLLGVDPPVCHCERAWFP